jgi:hypothetical protein
VGAVREFIAERWGLKREEVFEEQSFEEGRGLWRAEFWREIEVFEEQSLLKRDRYRLLNGIAVGCRTELLLRVLEVVE